MPRLAGWEETLHGLDDTVPGSLAADVPMKNLRGPGYLPRPVRAHLKRHTLRSDLHVSAEESAGSSDTAPAALSRGDQIEEDIEMGRYECGICCDEDINRKESIWYCQTCWAVYHFGCITRVALAARTDTVLADELHLIWRCPSCRSEYAGSPWELCCKSLIDNKAFIILLNTSRVQKKPTRQSGNYETFCELLWHGVSKTIILWTLMPQNLSCGPLRRVL